MKKLKKILIWFVVILGILIIGLYVTASVTVSHFKPRLENILTDELGYQTRINGSLALKLLPGVSFVINDLRIINNETYLVRIEKAEIAVDYRQLFNSDIDITGLSLVKPQVFIEHNTDGSFNYDIPEHAKNPHPAKKGQSHQIDIRHISIKNGRLIYFDNELSDTLIAKGIDVVSDEINFSGILDRMNMKKLRFTGSIHLGSLRINEMRLDSIQWKIEARSGKISVQSRSPRFFEGKYNGVTTIDFNTKPALVNIQSHITGLDIGEFREAAHLTGLFYGSLNYDMNLTFRSFNWKQAMSTLDGDLIITGQKMLLQGISLNSIILNYKDSKAFDVAGFAALFITGPFGTVFTKDIRFGYQPENNSGVSEDISRIVSNWTIHNGVARARDVALVTDRYRLTMTGQINLIGGNYNDVKIALINKFGCPVISLQMNGPFLSPEKESSSSISPSNISMVEFWKDLANSTRKYCKPVYSGSLKPPVAH